jgi:YesN/AraC family two-component response regulator
MEKYPIKVLYVEDEIMVREPFVEMLNRRVGQIYEAANGAEGLELYRKYEPDIVIADIKMPVMDGLTMAAHIRKKIPLCLSSLLLPSNLPNISKNV